jgi:hypothetical protein
LVQCNFRTISQELSDAIMQMVTNCTNMYNMSKVASARINPAGPPQTILRASQHHRPIESSSSQVLVDQLTGLATSLASLGLNPSAQSVSTFTLPGFNYILS